MKKSIIIITLLFAITTVFAQKGKVSTAISYKESGKLKEAIEAIEETIDPANEKSEKSIDWPRTWEARGEIYQAVFKSKDEEVKKLVDDPLSIALESYKKVLTLDDKGAYEKNIKIKLTLLVNDLTNQAVAAFNDGNYSKALKSFEQILELEDMPLLNDDGATVIDTVIIFNAGLAAYNDENYDTAIKFFKEAASHKYNGARTYQLISSCYISQNDTINALTSLKDGFLAYPENNAILVEMINIYLNANMVDDAMKYLDLAIKQDSTNASFYFAQGSLYDKLGEDNESIKCYEKAIELKDDFFDAYYNLGAVYYNKGVKQVDVANQVPSNEPEKYEAEKTKADLEFKKAIPYMERAHEINPKDEYTLESLKTLYYRLKYMDKHEQIVEKLKNLE